MTYNVSGTVIKNGYLHMKVIKEFVLHCYIKQEGKGVLQS
jgi:hypothetical protein